MKAKGYLKTIRFPLLVLLFVIQVALLLRLAWLTSPNRTEMGHFAASRSLWERGRFDLFHVNPPLIRLIAGLPVKLFTHPHDDWSHVTTDARDRSEWAVAVALVQANGADDIRKMIFLGRMFCIPLVLLGGWVGFLYARDLFGSAAAWVFLILWTFSPLLLGWGATICPDVAAASFGILGFYSFRHWLKYPTWKHTMISGVCLGLLPLVKMTWVIIFALIPLLWLILSTQRRAEWKSAILLFFIMLTTVNLGYLFEGTGTALGQYRFISKTLRGPHSDNRFADTLTGRIPVPFPREFVLGLDTQRLDFERGFPSYLCGRFSDHGWWSYYLVALVLKEPMGTLLLFFLALALFSQKSFRSTNHEEILLALPILALFTTVSAQTGFSMHTRYIIPVIPFLYIWCARVACIRADSQPSCGRRLRYVAVFAFLTMTVAGSLVRYPYCLSYFSEIVGGPINGPKYLLGSNVEWGQDLYELRSWYEEHPEARPLRIAYSGIYPLEVLGIHASDTPPPWTATQAASQHEEYLKTVGPQPGWFLLGINDLYGPSGAYAWLKEVEPVTRMGYSMNIYHLTRDQANKLRRQMKIPEID